MAVMLGRKRETTATPAAAVEQDQGAANSNANLMSGSKITWPSSTMEMEIGVGLIRLADPRAWRFLPRITGVRQTVASEIGIVLPKVRIRDNLRLSENRLPHQDCQQRGRGRPGLCRLLAMDSGVTSGKIPGRRRNRRSTSRRSGLIRIGESGPRCWVTRPSNRPPYWPHVEEVVPQTHNKLLATPPSG